MTIKKAYYSFVCIALLVLFALPAKGQQTQAFSQYLFNRFLLNPAAAGADGYTSIGLTVKDQWTGFSKTPGNQTLSAQIRLPREGIFGNRKRSYGGFSPENVGLGVALFNDMRGPIRTTGAQFTYAYHLEDRYGQLSFGLSGSIFQLRIDREKIVTADEDQFINASDLNTVVPDASFGVHYTTKDYYAGLSISNLFQSMLMFGGRNSKEYSIERQYNLLGGYVIELTSDYSLVPGTQIKFNEHGVGQLDLNVMLYYYDRFWGGLAYRSGGGGAAGAASIMFGARYKQYHFGYAFDYALSDIRKYSFGSHELMVSITFGQSDRFFRYKKRYEFQGTGSTGGSGRR